ncbi:MAG: PAS domain-containing protein [Myxococcota bacterium]
MEGDALVLRETVRFLERFRATIDREVDRRLGRGEPPPEARLEVIRRFRSFCRLASIDGGAARPSLDGLGGNSPTGLEKAIELAVDVACLCQPTPPVEQALRRLEAQFRTGIRRTLRPAEPQRRMRRGRRRALHGGRRVRSAIDRISDTYLAVDLDSGALADMNPAAEALLGAPAVTLVEKPFVDLIPPTDRARFAEIEARFDAEEDCDPLPLRLRRPDGTAIPVESSVAIHSFGGRRLAIFVARETSALATLEGGAPSPDPGAPESAAPAAPAPRVRERRGRSSVSAVVQALLGSGD